MKSLQNIKFTKKHFTDFLMMLVGTFLTAAGTSIFFAPNKIVCGGISGISTVLYYLTSIPIGTSYAIMNGILLLAGIKVLGKDFIIKTLIGTGTMSVFMDLLAYVPPITDNGILAALFGGILYGVGLGITFIAGASTGGTDILGRMVQFQFPSMGIGKLLMVIDGIIIAASIMVFKQADLVLLGIVGIFIQTIAIDTLINRMNVSELAFIITENGPDVSKMLIHDFERGVTVLNGKGAYTDRDKQVLLCAMKASETAVLQERIKEVDPEAFVIFSESKMIVGNGFQFYK